MEFTSRFLLFACLHSIFASNRVKQFTSRITGKEPRGYRLGYNLLSLAMFGWVMAAGPASAVLYFAPGIWSLVMYATQIIVAGILFRCLRQTGAGHFLGISQLRSEVIPHQQLVTAGCYARMRHPLYFYSTLFMALNPVMTIQWLMLTLLSLMYFILGAVIEERRLLDVYGEEFRLYRQQVPFFIPALRISRQIAGSKAPDYS
jgi:protein-S-isoprenylcysteine O-methyltransferase Ste14